MTDIQRNIFWVFLQLVYGKSFEEATNPILRMVEKQELETYYLSLLIDLLKLSVYYKVSTIKNRVENIIIGGNHINAHSLCKIIECLKECEECEECNVQQLKDFYKKHSKLNKNPVKDQLSELDRKSPEVVQISKMLRLFLEDDSFV